MKNKKHKSRKKKYGRVPSSLKSRAISFEDKAEGRRASGKLPDRLEMERLNRAVGKILEKQDFRDDRDLDRFMEEKITGKKIDEIYQMIELDSSDEAQELAYEAMAEEDRNKALELANKALELDPDCIDARLVEAKCSSRSLPELVEKLERIISRAEENFGEQYIEENKGHFWKLVETRPYMRALDSLLIFLRLAGRTKEAILQAEKMLELNPDDNQGIRDSLLGMYLETGNLEGARKLLERYPTEYLAVFLWGRVLERYLSGEIKEAAAVFKKAYSKNPHVFDYLTGRKQFESELLDSSYMVGKESEAIHCFMEIGPAWKKNPEAIDWLKSL